MVLEARTVIKMCLNFRTGFACSNLGGLRVRRTCVPWLADAIRGKVVLTRFTRDGLGFGDAEHPSCMIVTASPICAIQDEIRAEGKLHCSEVARLKQAQAKSVTRTARFDGDGAGWPRISARGPRHWHSQCLGANHQDPRSRSWEAPPPLKSAVGAARSWWSWEQGRPAEN